MKAMYDITVYVLIEFEDDTLTVSTLNINECSNDLHVADLDKLLDTFVETAGKTFNKTVTTARCVSKEVYDKVDAAQKKLGCTTISHKFGEPKDN